MPNRSQSKFSFTRPFMTGLADWRPWFPATPGTCTLPNSSAIIVSAAARISAQNRQVSRIGAALVTRSSVRSSPFTMSPPHITTAPSKVTPAM